MKNELIAYVKNYLDQRIQTSKDAMDAAQASANGESKSSAGDKYETSRAMGQLDRDMHGLMHEQAKQERAIIERLDPTMVYKKGALGACIKTNSGIFFIAVSVGVATIEQEKIMIISPQSPIGTLLMGKVKGDTFSFRGKESVIEEVL
jgi:transcription elongation GreA/GreB family factor